VLGQDGQKLSKRHGSTSVNEFRALGYLPEALVNYVALLGCSFEEGRDLYSLADLAAAFRIEKLNKASAVFDYKKLEWYNGQYVRMKSDDELAGLCAPYLAKAGLIGDPPGVAEKDRLRLAIPLVRERLSLLGGVGDSLKFLFSDIPAPSPDDLVPKKLDAAKTAAVLAALRDILAELAAPDEQAVEIRVRGLAEEFGVKLGDFLMPLRVALTGSRVSPPLFGSLRVLGVETARIRIDRAIAVLSDRSGT
jgi:glutamyl-tRNA synthetase